MGSEYTPALEVKGLRKEYKGFALEGMNLTIEKGKIMGLVGENGAGKTTAMKAMLGIIRPDGGAVRILGKDFSSDDVELKNRIGVVLDEVNFYETMTAKQVGKVCAGVFGGWNEEIFQQNLERMNVAMNKKIKDYSKGMRIKLSLAAAMSHGAELLILDEPTSGLDPVAREEILEEFKAFTEDGEGAILLSSHITSDLEKIADDITFIHKGKTIFTKSREELGRIGNIDDIMTEYVRGHRQ